MQRAQIHFSALQSPLLLFILFFPPLLF
jgi:hypothetical protein